MYSNTTIPNEIAPLQGMVQTLQLRVCQLEKVIRYLKGQRFGSSSEKLSDEQLALFAIEEPVLKKEEITPVTSYERIKRGCRNKLPESIERIRVEHDLSEEEKQCPCGCGEMGRIGEETNEQLDIEPATFRVIKHVRFKYACKKCEEGVHIAPQPLQIIPKSNATPNLLAYIAMGKIADALPLYRQSKIFERLGFKMSRSTMARWMVQIGEKTQPLINLLWDHILEQNYIGIDETSIQVLREENRKPQTKSYMWVIRAGPLEQIATIFHYDPSRSREVLKRILDGYQGYLQADGLKTYTGMDQLPEITLIGCWAHARRYFHRVIKANGNKKSAGSVAMQGINWIRKLYKIERELKERNASYQERYEERQERSKAVLDEMKTWLDDVIVKVPPKSKTGEALHYLNNQWKYLIRYIDDGRLEIDNNLVENAIRPFVVGRKNWLFSETPEGAHSSANLYTLVETAKNNGIEPYKYFSTLFHTLPYAASVDDYEKLLPWNLCPVSK